ncbi:restriction endonuclease subunit S [Micromonospora sp. NBC_00858]|uniref:restriction endonuclease subunit S n=1 Tax=Micromonospora sp. NBC_00858 TaxID=2975979 RepID=UPI00386D42DF|nr:restriction endonuclease subunit S [Micromonospora sp. NBC_00858]
MRIKDVAQINQSTLPETTDPGYEFKYVDIAAVDALGGVTVPVAATTFGEAPSRARRLASPGATIVSTVRTYLRAIGRVPNLEDTLVFSTGFAVLEAGSQVDPGYLSYLCRSEPFVQYVVSRSVGVSYPAINASDLGNFKIELPPIGQQRRIADFLDVETERLDRVRAARARMKELLQLKRARVIEHLIGHDNGEPELVPLKYLVERVTVGIVITPAAWYVEGGGVPALRGINVKSGRIDAKDLVQISPQGHLLHSKSRLRTGDLVVVRTGQAGTAAIVTPEFDGANCIDLVIVRPGPLIVPRFAEYLLNSSYAKRRVAEFAVGSIQSHFNVAAMKAMPVPRRSLPDQQRLVSEIEEAIEPIDKSISRIEEQDRLLGERRQALITAAVAGRIDLTTA